MDVKLKEKVDNVDIEPYKILGICNPGFAYKTLQIEENIGVFLPCKAIVKDIGEGKIEVVVVNPAALMGMLNKPELVSISNVVYAKFQKTLEYLYCNVKIKIPYIKNGLPIRRKYDSDEVGWITNHQETGFRYRKPQSYGLPFRRR